MMHFKNLNKKRLTVSLACIAAAVLAPYYFGLLWILLNPGIFKPDALSSSPAVLWGTGLLGLCIVGIIGLTGGLAVYLAGKGFQGWAHWVASNGRKPKEEAE